MPATQEFTVKINADADEALAKLRELRRVSISAGLVSPHYVVVGMIIGFILGVVAGLGVTV
jgi:hypothetical protein